MKINISSRTISLVISFLFAAAVSILAIVFIGKGTKDNDISFDEFSVIEYSEHDGWTDVSISEQESKDESFEESAENNVSKELTAIEVVEFINGNNICDGENTEEMLSDEVGMHLFEAGWMREYTPENVYYSLGYIFIGDKIFNTNGDDLTDLLSGYTFLEKRDINGNVMFEKDGKYFYVDSGKMVESKDTDILFKGPMYLVNRDDFPTLFKSNDKWGAKNNKGETIVKSSYTYGFGFYDGIGCFASKKEYLYVFDDKGTSISSSYMLPQNFSNVFMFQNGICMVTDEKDRTKNLILKSNGSLLDIPEDYKVVSCSDGVIKLEKNGLYGYMNHTGKWIANPVFTSASDFSEGLSVVYDNGYYVIDRNGETIIPKGFDYVTEFSASGALLYSEENGWYFASKLFKAK